MRRVALLAFLLSGPAWSQTAGTPATTTYCDSQPGPNRCREISLPIASTETFMRIDPKITAQLDRIEQMLLALKAHEDDVLHAHDFPVCTPQSSGLCRTEEKP